MTAPSTQRARDLFRRARSAGPADTGAFLAALRDPDPAVRRAGAIGLDTIGDPALTETLVAHLDDPDPLVQSSVGWALVHLGPPARAPVVALLDRPGTAPDTRMMASLILERLGRPRATIGPPRRAPAAERPSHQQTVLHDIRNAVAPVVLGVDAALACEDPREVRELLEELAVSTRWLGALAEHLQPAAEATAPARTTLPALVASMTPVLDTLAKARGVHWSYTEGAGAHVPVVASRFALGRGLFNAVHNAAKASPPGALVQVVVAARDGEVILSVLDDGPGFQSHGPSYERGHGLGLEVARAAVATAGGRLVTENRVEGGAAVRFALPAARYDA